MVRELDRQIGEAQLELERRTAAQDAELSWRTG
jgi:hypothetical protein